MATTSNEVATITWTGKSGTGYKYWIYPLGTSFRAEPGNYVFAKESTPNRWLPLYVGQTGDLSERFDGHHKLDCAKRKGATHVHVHINNGGEQTRLNEEADLVASWSPPCNG